MSQEKECFEFVAIHETISTQYLQWVKKNYQVFIPYERKTTNEVIIDEAQYVRNIASICDILQYRSELPKSLLALIESNLVQ